MSFAESHEKNDWLQQGVEARALSRENRRTFDMFRDPPSTQYGDSSPRTAGRAEAKLMERAGLHLLERFGEQKTVKFRRYNALAPATRPLAEGAFPIPAIDVDLDEYRGGIQFAGYVNERNPATDPAFLACREAIQAEIERIMSNIEYRVVNPRPSASDPLAQVGQVLWRITKSGGEQVKIEGAPTDTVRPRRHYWQHNRLVGGPGA